jgi:hypothetical protein
VTGRSVITSGYGSGRASHVILTANVGARNGDCLLSRIDH